MARCPHWDLFSPLDTYANHPEHVGSVFVVGMEVSAVVARYERALIYPKSSVLPGVAVMALSIPLSSHMAKSQRGVQIEKMKRVCPRTLHALFVCSISHRATAEFKASLRVRLQYFLQYCTSESGTSD